MSSHYTDTLSIGSSLPQFRLGAANRVGDYCLSDFLREGPLILEVLRGTWCPNCQKRMAEWEDKKSHLDLMGAQLAYIAAEKRDGLWKPEEFLKKHPVSFPFLLDEDRSVTKAFGLYHPIGIDSFNIAHPATLIADREGIVRYIYRGANQSDRAPFAEVTESLKLFSK